MQNDVIGIHPKYGMVGRIEVQTYRIILQYVPILSQKRFADYLDVIHDRFIHRQVRLIFGPINLSDRNLHRPVRTACNDLYSLFTAFQLVIRSAKFVRHAIHLVAAAFSQAACTNKRNISVTAVIVDLF